MPELTRAVIGKSLVRDPPGLICAIRRDNADSDAGVAARAAALQTRGRFRIFDRDCAQRLCSSPPRLR
jgi:hypothetical protein